MIMKITDSYLARRRFLCGMLGSGAAAMGAGAGVPLAAYVGNLSQDPPPEWLELAADQFDLPPGTAMKVWYGPIVALLIKTPGPNSVLKVFDATCTHLTCKVNYKPDENRIFCPCHKGYFDVDGRAIAGPPTLPLREFHHRTSGNRLVIALEKENLEKAFSDS